MNTELYIQITAALGGIVAAASAVAALTPTPKDDKFVTGAKRWIAKVYRIIDILALNVGRAKDKGK
tara:strand:- start:2008 stop:2205 length:198 start_codon:yes stop_codon:yes gene_type:complete